MTLNIFFLLLVSHVLGDAIFTSYRLAVLKRNQRLSDQVLAISYHCSVHALFAGLLLLILGRLWLKGALLVLAIHFGIDFLRCRVEMGLKFPLPLRGEGGTFEGYL
jgi:Zn-dependent membrane protease YugP